VWHYLIPRRVPREPLTTKTPEVSLSYAAYIDMSANLLRLRPGALFNSFFWFLDIKLGELLLVKR
jgi:hypothetical protein